MKAFEINSGWQRHLVVCDTIAEAEEIFNKKYGICAANEIKLIADYVQVKGVKGWDEKP
jgi:hypothetical protein